MDNIHHRPASRKNGFLLSEVFSSFTAFLVNGVHFNVTVRFPAPSCRGKPEAARIFHVKNNSIACEPPMPSYGTGRQLHHGAVPFPVGSTSHSIMLLPGRCGNWFFFHPQLQTGEGPPTSSFRIISSASKISTSSLAPSQRYITSGNSTVIGGPTATC
ncbi:uncharacterized protein TEOVI_000356800 [Trypanosoma equiperdum]|uniref:T. brucei spp.-specific protein n=2 Tax=Trypanozoon TaxID=39700 RepID=Q57V16_TRYB2|nr:hypothetical protein Tb927.7.1940 [Trypanosoma brucei brucei TREU927]AAX70553.1 hypothetical protein Tb927.7.1940 [Trypanosoma brucei]AAZ12259.1 hypothetical protein Tb927.7.1940 [Trypanosoma brucei brucei TREU927]SCU71986.1 hypothetical protein, conserved [Trypanosoma equiperdum]